MNKVNTKVELRFTIEKADWLPDTVKVRLQELRPQNIFSGDFIVQSQLTRHQEGNIRDALDKLQSYVDEAAVPVKERVVEEYKEPEVLKARRIDSKRKKGETKKLRGSSFDF